MGGTKLLDSVKISITQYMIHSISLKGIKVRVVQSLVFREFVLSLD